MIIYGINPVHEAVRSGRAVELLVQEPHGDRVRAVVADARAAGVPVRTVAPDAFRKLVPSGVHQGLAARIAPKATTSLEALASHALGAPLIVVLDGVEDPHNVGAILRTVHAAGASGVVRQS